MASVFFVRVHSILALSTIAPFGPSPYSVIIGGSRDRDQRFGKLSLFASTVEEFELDRAARSTRTRIINLTKTPDLFFAIETC